MKVTIINNVRDEKRYSRIELNEFINQLCDGTYRQHYIRDFKKEVCFGAVGRWLPSDGTPSSFEGWCRFMG